MALLKRNACICIWDESRVTIRIDPLFGGFVQTIHDSDHSTGEGLDQSVAKAVETSGWIWTVPMGR